MGAGDQTTAVTVRARLRPQTQEDADALIALLRRWSATFRWAWKQIARHNDRAIVDHLNALHARQRSRPPRLKTPKGIWRQATAFSGLPFGLAEAAVQDALDKLRAYLEAHVERCRRGRRNGPRRCHPASVVFGGRRLMRRLARTRRGTPEHEALRSEWRLRRQGRASVGRGRARDGGNILCRFDFASGRVRILVGRDGKRLKYIECAFSTRHARWGEFRAWAEGGKAYSATIRLRRATPPKFEILLSWVPDAPAPEPHDGSGSVVGVDLNATDRHFVSWAVASPDGNLIGRGRIRIRTAPARHRRTQCFEIAHRICNIAALYKASAIALEDLSKPLARRGSGLRDDGRPIRGARKSRRRVHEWPLRTFLESLASVARRRRERIAYVDPAYTSRIGLLKYAPTLNLSVHQGAAYAIARRAQDRTERLPRALRVLSASVRVSRAGPSERGRAGSGSGAVELRKQEGVDGSRHHRWAASDNPWRDLDVPALTAHLAEAVGCRSIWPIAPSRLAAVYHDPDRLRPGPPAGDGGRDRAIEADGAADVRGPMLPRGPGPAKAGLRPHQVVAKAVVAEGVGAEVRALIESD